MENHEKQRHNAHILQDRLYVKALDTFLPLQ